jgi:hypothetical protein
LIDVQGRVVAFQTSKNFKKSQIGLFMASTSDLRKIKFTYFVTDDFENQYEKILIKMGKNDFIM